MKDSNGGSIFVHNISEAFIGGTNVSSSYFDTLCRQSFPGPLARNVGGKELNKWIDERITDLESSNIDYRNSEVLKLLFSLLKIASQHHGKLRSPFGTDATSKVNFFVFKLLLTCLNVLTVNVVPLWPIFASCYI